MCGRTSALSVLCSLFSWSTRHWLSIHWNACEVQLHQLLLHHRRYFQEWCKNSRLAASWARPYYPPQNGGIRSTRLEEVLWRLQPSERLLFIYLYFLSLSSCCLQHSLIFINNKTWLASQFQNKRWNAWCVFLPWLLWGGSGIHAALAFFQASL